MSACIGRLAGEAFWSMVKLVRPCRKSAARVASHSGTCIEACVSFFCHWSTSCACAVAGLEACRLPRGRSASTCAMPWAASLIASELRLRWATW